MVKAIFFDKDGVLNKMVERENMWTAPWTLDEFEFTDGAKMAVNLVKSYGYKTFMITNQPDMLDGKMTATALHDILHLNDSYFGFDGIKAAIKRNEPDYKPNTGMVDFFVEKYNIDVNQSFMIGDSWKDIVCGQRAGLTTYYIGNPEKGYLWDAPEEYKDLKPTYITTDIMSACMNIVMEKMDETIC
jgi:D-glycero-D-manno-heptose 1,7-bisphosphate phosphatase